MRLDRDSCDDLGLLRGCQESDKAKLAFGSVNQLLGQLHRRTAAPAGDLSEVFERSAGGLCYLFGSIAAMFLNKSFSIHTHKIAKCYQ